MRVGLDGWLEEDADWFRELGATITKLPLADCDGGVNKEFGKRLGAAREAGMDVVIDLRPSGVLEKEIMNLQIDPDKEGVKARAVRKRWHDGIAANVREFGSDAYAWEVWGEYACPHVGGFYPSDKMTYPLLLADAFSAVKSEDAGARVWNGGYGVDFDTSWLAGIVAKDPIGDTYTHQNWHHYNRRFFGTLDAEGKMNPGEPLHKRVRYSADQYRKLFALAHQMSPRPLVSSEWGLHVVSDDVVAGSRYCGLFSFTCDGDIPALGDTEAAEYLEAYFEVFEEAGFETLIYHRLHDNALSAEIGGSDRIFWGNFCGLLYADGSEKTATLATVKRWCGK